MSLRRLMKCKLTVFTAKEAIVDSTGAYDRETAWAANIFKDSNGRVYENVRCNLQSWKRGMNVVEIAGIKEEEIQYQVFHQHSQLYDTLNSDPSAAFLIAFNKNPTKLITDNTNKDQINTFEYLGKAELVTHIRKRKQLFEMYLKLNNIFFQ